ncbi:MAG: hypothetical protein GDA67_15460 [Nitrospira sp. CR1.3]|nr:hypothetical protein [Nitrospira sp. CR1.3]
MSFRIVESAVAAEQADALHEARLLLMLRQQADKGDGTVNGITKLAKMDFLLRYPLYFERLLKATRKRPPAVVMEPYERDTVESRMIRFRYGPWDRRYRRWIGLMVAKGLVDSFVSGRTVHVRVTNRGRQLADAIAHREEFANLNARTEQVSKAVGAMSGSGLKDLIYQVVPELMGMSWGEEIQP